MLKSIASAKEIRTAFANLPETLRKVLPEKALQTNMIRDQLKELHELLKANSDKTGGW